MASNFLGAVEAPRGSRILSGGELIAREGVNLQKGMNLREEPLRSVFLVLPREGAYRDAWDAATETLLFEGHDSVTVEGGRSRDQLLAYESGRLTDNGKFYKAAHAYKDGVHAAPLQVQVYEKLDPGVWYDKGIFDLVDAQAAEREGRKVFLFHLVPPDRGHAAASDQDRRERLLPAACKEALWRRDRGRCAVCSSEVGLGFAGEGDDPAALSLRCAAHGGRAGQGLL